MQKEQIASGSRFHVAVIGAGASGTLVAAQFHRLAPEGRLALIGDASRPARGVAYETPYSANLLNVPAGGMSGLAQDGNHFVNWLQQRMPGAGAGADTFAPRRLYGEYLGEILAAATGPASRIEVVQDAAVAMDWHDDHWMVRLRGGRTLAALRVVLAFGNLQIPGDPIDFTAVAPLYWRNPWAADSVTGLAPDAPVLLIGTGLTMADVALSLREVGHRGPLHALSRHGRLYQAHLDGPTPPLPLPPDGFGSPAGALRQIRRAIEDAKAEGLDWRSAVDGLRPHTAAIWQSWSLAQRRTFLRHARNLWDTHRHRMAPEVGRQLAALIDQGTLTIHRGSLVAATTEGSRAVVTWKRTAAAATPARKTAAAGSAPNSANAADPFRVSRIVNCTGPARDYSFNQSPLIAQLRTDGKLVPDALRLGFETDADGRFIAADGRPVAGLFTLGPIRIPELWESIAMPEIRHQALALAATLAAETVARDAIAPLRR